jgi:lipid-A-disaccharide synthase
MKYYIIAGEASGDLHGSNLIKELRKRDPRAVIRSWGGDLMQAAGSEVVKHYRDLAFMGFAEVIKNLPAILGNIRWCKQDIATFQPDVVVLIDYPGFNLRIAEWAKAQGLKVVYYISPQVWAWKESRVKLIRKVVDRMLVILPFEKDFYTRWDYKVEYVGHPLVQVVQEYRAQHPQPLLSFPKPVIALLPGSRKQEVAKKLPVMLGVSRFFPQYQFVVAQAGSLDDGYFRELLQAFPEVQFVKNQTYDLLSIARGALVTSGTATLETALFGVPQVVCYKGSALSYHIAKRLVKIRYISLVNLIMDKPVVTELIQQELTVENARRELDAVLHDTERSAQIRKDYEDLKTLLQQQGHASAKAAESILELVRTATA